MAAFACDLDKHGHDMPYCYQSYEMDNEIESAILGFVLG
jgi:hypothetical protein